MQALVTLFLATFTLAVAPGDTAVNPSATFADQWANHYKCYTVRPVPFQIMVTTDDQFGHADTQVFEPRLLCNPVSKNGEPVPQPEVHLVCYRIQDEPPHVPRKVLVQNQFGEMVLQTEVEDLLCVPSTKIEL